MNKTITAVDLFCGAGGATNALLQACKQRGYKLRITGINHWPLAIKTHSANHEYAEHLCADINEVDPLTIVPSGKLDILMAGVECIFFSTARGGKPINNQRRSTGWKVLEWAEKLHIRTIIIENVPEFQRWGPLYTSGPKKDKPIKKLEGQIFLAFVNALKAMGYTTDYRVLCAADYGDPTTRERFFLVATRGRHKPLWPEPTHSKDGKTEMFGRKKRWVPVKKIIDWEDKGISIFNRELYGKKPLVDNTMKRIYAGMAKFWGVPFVIPQQSSGLPRSVADPLPTVAGAGAIGLVEPRMIDDPSLAFFKQALQFDVQPFIVMQNGTADNQLKQSNRSINEPAPTLTACRHIGVVEPFIFNNRGGDDGYLRSSSINDPLGTLTTSPAECLIEPFILPLEGFNRGNQPRSVDDTLQTVTSRGAGYVVEPFLISAEHVGNGNDQRVHSGTQPMPTLTTKSDFGVVQPFIFTQAHTTGKGKRKEDGRRCYPTDEPMPTLTGDNSWAAVKAFLVSYHGGEQGDKRSESVDEPMGTLDTANRRALVQPFLVEYHGTGGPSSIDQPLDTITTKPRNALVTPEWVKDLPPGYKLLYIPGIGLLDVRHRMLRPRECARAHSFSDSYTFLGNQDDQMRMIGNSWPVKLGAAICGAQIDAMAEASKR